MKKISKKALSGYITKFYAAASVDKSINIFDIGKVFKAGEDAYASTKDLLEVEKAVKAAADTYCISL
jgi:hypothetical protein